MNNIVKSSLFVCLTALVLPVYAADTGTSNGAMTSQQEKSEPVKQVVRHHYRHHHHHYHHHYCVNCHRGGYHHRHGYRYGYTYGSCSTCGYRHSCGHSWGCGDRCHPTNVFYHHGCCPTNVFYHGCGSCANRGDCAPRYC